MQFAAQDRGGIFRELSTLTIFFAGAFAGVVFVRRKASNNSDKQSTCEGGHKSARLASSEDGNGWIESQPDGFNADNQDWEWGGSGSKRHNLLFPHKVDR